VSTARCWLDLAAGIAALYCATSRPVDIIERAVTAKLLKASPLDRASTGT